MIYKVYFLLGVIKKIFYYNYFIIKFWPVLDYNMFVKWIDNIKINSFYLENAPHITAEQDNLFQSFISYNNKQTHNNFNDINSYVKNVSIEIKHFIDVDFIFPDIASLCIALQKDLYDDSKYTAICF